MERITEDQIARLVSFVHARILDADSLQEEACRTVTALRLVVDKQVAAVRYFRSSPSGSAAVAEHANASWNLLVSIARIWRDHSEFPIDAAMETFDFDAESPLMLTK
ncbi:hypothetical protein [Streptomyces sp. ID05-47C]|uniref:hypothetical protein n=1 Tax=Streptomyces sp. ID05-47C TaxID=3028665 RepID=UPI0029A37C8A|nr:hypothetical protein [Streptomyces sp. ID05-47C]MDX3570467.1 hypothetical protein [Streptomyces sp. ID05-47C]